MSNTPDTQMFRRHQSCLQFGYGEPDAGSNAHLQATCIFELLTLHLQSSFFFGNRVWFYDFNSQFLLAYSSCFKKKRTSLKEVQT